MAKRLKAFSRPAPATRRLEVKERDPNFMYRWVNAEKDGNIDMKMELGYQYVTKGEARGAGDEGIPGNAIRAGELVLMRCPIDEFNARREELEEYNKMFHNRAFEEFLTKAESMNVEVENKSRIRQGSNAEED